MPELREGVLVACGNPLLDISCTVNDEYLKKHELGADSAILAEDKHMEIFTDLEKNYKPDFIAGGSAQNSVRVCQWILQKPNVCTYFGCVGEDEYAAILEKSARADGVNVRYQKRSDTVTGKCAVLITGRHRSLIAHLAAAIKFSIDHILEEENFKYIEQADFYYISGFFLVVSLPSIITIAKKALERDRPLIMNLSAPYISDIFREQLMEALPYIDILIGNESEALTFSKVQNFGTENLKEIGFKILNMPKLNEKRKRVVVLTQGHDPVLLFENDTIREFPVVELTENEIVDTNGAGDAFVGGFLSQLVQYKSYDDCINVGIQAAREIIQRSGCSVEGTFCYPQSLE